MPLNKIRLANKKHRREIRRKTVRGVAAKTRRQSRLAQRQMRKMINEGRQEMRRKRQADADYLEKLEAELINGQE